MNTYAQNIITELQHTYSVGSKDQRYTKARLRRQLRLAELFYTAKLASAASCARSQEKGK